MSGSCSVHQFVFQISHRIHSAQRVIPSDISKPLAVPLVHQLIDTSVVSERGLSSCCFSFTVTSNVKFVQNCSLQPAKLMTSHHPQLYFVFIANQQMLA